MNPSDDPFAGLGSDGSARFREPLVGWSSDGARLAFWLIAIAGTAVLCLAWFWYGLAFFDEMTEQCKSVAAGSSSAGTGLLLGGLPLVLSYLVILILLLLVGAKYHSQRRRGLLIALLAVAVASVISIGVNELVWTGDLFAMSAAHAGCSQISP